MKKIISKLSAVLLATICSIVSVFMIPSSTIIASASKRYSSPITITSALSNGKVVDVNGASKANRANIQLYDLNGTAAQIFRFVEEGNGYYSIQALCARNKVLDIEGGRGYSGCNVITYDYHGGDNQLWYLRGVGNGYCEIVSKSGGYCLDVSGANTSNYTNIQVYYSNKTNAQRFKLSFFKINDAISYAQKWTDNSGKSTGGTFNSSSYNRYQPFSLFDPSTWGYNGHDCANYLSQILYSGGMKENNEWRRVGKGQNYKNISGGTTWVSAINLANYLINRWYPYKIVKSLSDIERGDVVFLRDSNGQVYHSTFCTGKSGGKPYYCAHSCWRKNYSYDLKTAKNAYAIDVDFSSVPLPVAW